MTFDRPASQNAPDEGPRIYALLIGVSAYPHLFEHDDDPAPEEHLGLQRLASPALTVHRLYEWLDGHRDSLPLPLAPCRVLVSASPSELQLEPKLARWTSGATLEETVNAIIDWRNDLAKDSNSIGFFYFAGHGIKRKRRDDILLMNEFGVKSHRLLKYAIDSTSLVNGMAPSKQFPGIARTQLYFFDACRVKPAIFQKYEEALPDPLWDETEIAKADDRSILMIYTTVPGAESHGRRDDQSFFSKALMRCLDGKAAEAVTEDPTMSKWVVTSTSILSNIQKQLDLLAGEHNVYQQVEIGKSPSRSFVLVESTEPPTAEVQLHIEPKEASACAKVSVLDVHDSPAWVLPFPVDPLPHHGRINAGIYKVGARDGREKPKWDDVTRILWAPPHGMAKWELRLPRDSEDAAP